MGYESALHLIDIKIRKELVPEVQKAIATWKEKKNPEMECFLECAAIDAQGFLAFKLQEDGLDLYEPCEGEDTVPARIGKWRSPESIANWIKQLTEEGGRIVFHSAEADGAAWGWEFDGKGHMRALALVSCGEWEKRIMSKQGNGMNIDDLARVFNE